MMTWFANCAPRSPLDPRWTSPASVLPPLDRWSRSAASVVLRAYRYLLSPLLGGNCRFEPSCSAYAEQAIWRHGYRGGAAMVIRRLSRCHPWGGPGGYDPVS